MAEADAEQRDLRLEQRLDGRHGVVAGLRRIARAVRQEDAVGPQRQNLLGGRRRRHDRHRAAAVVEEPQDVALDPVVDRHDVEARLEPPAVAALQRPARLVPVVALGRADRGTRSMPSMPGQRAASARSASRSKAPSGAWAMTAFGMPALRISVVSARVSTPARPTMPRDLSQASSRPWARKFDGSREVGAEDRADRGGRGGGVDDLDVLVVDADDADMGEGEGDDLGGVGRVGQDLLIAGHRGVEADLADRRAGRADAEAFDHVAVREHEHAGRDARPPAGASVRPVPDVVRSVLRLPCGCA